MGVNFFRVKNDQTGGGGGGAGGGLAKDHTFSRFFFFEPSPKSLSSWKHKYAGSKIQLYETDIVHPHNSKHTTSYIMHIQTSYLVWTRPAHELHNELLLSLLLSFRLPWSFPSFPVSRQLDLPVVDVSCQPDHHHNHQGASPTPAGSRTRACVWETKERQLLNEAFTVVDIIIITSDNSGFTVDVGEHPSPK